MCAGRRVTRPSFPADKGQPTIEFTTVVVTVAESQTLSDAPILLHTNKVKSSNASKQWDRLQSKRKPKQNSERRSCEDNLGRPSQFHACSFILASADE